MRPVDERTLHASVSSIGRALESQPGLWVSSSRGRGFEPAYGGRDGGRLGGPPSIVLPARESTVARLNGTSHPVNSFLHLGYCVPCILPSMLMLSQAGHLFLCLKLQIYPLQLSKLWNLC